MSFAEILGLVAGAITTGSFVPQVIRVYKLKSAREISLTFIMAFIVGDSAWLVYGILFNLFPVIFWNVLAILLALTLLFGKLKYSRDIKRTSMPAKVQASIINQREKSQKV